jgi:uncharacterized protein YacL
MFQIIRFLLVITGTVMGVALSYGVHTQYPNFLETENAEIKLAALLGCIGYLLCSMIGRELELWLQSKIDNTNSYDLAWGALGFVLGLVSANLLLIPMYFIMYKGYDEIPLDNPYFKSLIPLFHLVFPLFFNLLFAYLGMAITFRFRTAQSRMAPGSISVAPKLIDTSAIIDGRFADLFRLGFLEGQLFIPKFVVNELQFLADGSDAGKRSKARQGLELLNHLRKEFPDHILISEKDFPRFIEVDAKLVEQAKADGAVLITQDFNLKKVAELQDVRVLNLNDLMNALKPIVISGEEVEIQIIKMGKDASQGVGYLPDGTMIVVEDGGDHIGKRVLTTVTNILQTTAGRMIFTRIGKRK